MSDYGWSSPAFSFFFFCEKAQLPGTRGFTDDSASDNGAIEMHSHCPGLNVRG